MKYKRKLVGLYGEKVEDSSVIFTSTEPLVIKNVSGPAKGLYRISLDTRCYLDLDEKGEIKQFLYALYSENAYRYMLDSTGPFKIDEDTGVGTFSSRNVEYILRSIQENEKSSWSFLQEWKAERGVE